MTDTSHFVGGPWDGEKHQIFTAIPTLRIPVFAQPAADMVCADEQVITKEGEYRRTLKTEAFGNTFWTYEWHEPA